MRVPSISVASLTDAFDRKTREEYGSSVWDGRIGIPNSGSPGDGHNYHTRSLHRRAAIYISSMCTYISRVYMYVAPLKRGTTPLSSLYILSFSLYGFSIRVKPGHKAERLESATYKPGLSLYSFIRE